MAPEAKDLTIGDDCLMGIGSWVKSALDYTIEGGDGEIVLITPIGVNHDLLGIGSGAESAVDYKTEEGDDEIDLTDSSASVARRDQTLSGATSSSQYSPPWSSEHGCICTADSYREINTTMMYPVVGDNDETASTWSLVVNVDPASEDSK